jgi:hypothetical protein
MELKSMKQEEIKQVEIYYEWIQKLAHVYKYQPQIIF